MTDEARSRRDSGVGTWLRALRAQAGLTQDQVAERMHVHVTAIRHLERGATDPGITRVIRYCEAIGARIHIGLKEEL
ncbi:MAG: helix-turn-helix domain-containing protein [Actinomycetota bacterium]|nr:helix-turn-helix domain-containing protein [Actinomycetota bacterium]